MTTLNRFYGARKAVDEAQLIQAEKEKLIFEIDRLEGARIKRATSLLDISISCDRFSGASSFASATDLRYGRDPTANHCNVSQSLALKALGRVKQALF
jgi:hypothetical protein